MAYTQRPTFGTGKPAEGMFNQTGGSNFYQAPSYMDVGTDPMGPKYDISNINAGLGMMKGNNYKTKQYNPYQFSTPGLNTLGSYGKTSDADMSNVYGKSLSMATRPLRAQGEERMRGMSQGFEGGRFGGAANREMAMKSSMQTGSDISDVAGGIGTAMSERMLGQDETAREKEWSDKGSVRDSLFAAEQNKQISQASENLKAAGFNDEQARYLAEFITSKAGMFINTGKDLAGMQRTGYQDQQTRYNDLMGGFGQYSNNQGKG